MNTFLCLKRKMKRSNIYIIVWLLIGAALAIIDWKWMVVWIISGYLTGVIDSNKNKENMSKKEIPPYIN